MAFVLPVKPKVNATSGHAPLTTDLSSGELGVNIADGILYLNYSPGGTPTILAIAGNGITPVYADVTIAGLTTNYADPSLLDALNSISGTLATQATSISGKAPLASPTFTGTPAAPTPTTGDSSTKIATTSYVQGELTKYPLLTNTGGTTIAAATGLTLNSSGSNVTINGGIAVSSAGAITLSHSTTVTAGTVTLNSGVGFVLSAYGASNLLGLDSSRNVGSVVLSNGLVAGSLTLTIDPTKILPTAPTAKTAAYTALQADNNTTIVFNSSSSLAITLPALSAGTTITVAQRGSGKVTWTASGTTVTVYPSGSTGTAGIGAQFTAYYDTGTTILIGGAVS